MKMEFYIKNGRQVPRKCILQVISIIGTIHNILVLQIILEIGKFLSQEMMMGLMLSLMVHKSKHTLRMLMVIMSIEFLHGLLQQNKMKIINCMTVYFGILRLNMNSKILDHLNIDVLKYMKYLFLFNRKCHIGMAGIESRVHSFKEFTKNVLPRVKSLGYNTI